MFIGPVFTREAITAPRRPQFFVVRVLFVAALLGLTLTAWQLIVGSGSLAGPGDFARFGSTVFKLLSPLVLTVSILFSALLSAAAVSQEKSRGTLILLLLTDLRNSELVVGRLLASLLIVIVAVLAVVPFFLILSLLGGIELGQVVNVVGVTLGGALVAGSLGSLLALWREKTFQALALTAIGLVLWLAVGEAIGAGAFGAKPLGVEANQLAGWVSPWRALSLATEPRLGPPPAFLTAENVTGINSSTDQLPTVASAYVASSYVATSAQTVARFVLHAFAAVLLINGFAVAMVRVWNPSRETRRTTRADEASSEEAAAFTATTTATAAATATAGTESVDNLVGKARGQEAAVHHAGGRSREVWDNPILWREVRTWAYGKKVLVVKFAYLAIFAFCTMAVVQAAGGPLGGGSARSGLPAAATPMAPLLVVSMVLINALSVTSITGERDGKSLDLLLATDLSPKELIFGKLGGAFWNAREMVVLPLALCGYMAWLGMLTPWLLMLMVVSLVVFDLFSAVLGLHAGMVYVSSRKAIGVSVGTLLFLFLGVTTCMQMMRALSDSFENQLASFLGFIIGGGIAMFVALAWRNPSTAMGLASIAAPLATFLAITSFLIGDYSLTALWTVLTFGFATAAMLVPALSEFDVATGATPDKD